MGEKSLTVEGHKYVISYIIREGAKTPGGLQITRNYTNAVKKINGSVVYEDQSSKRAVMKIVKNGKEVWVEVAPEDSAEAYNLWPSSKNRRWPKT